MSRLTNKKIVDLKDGEFLSISKEEYRKQVHEAPTYKEVYTKLGKLEDLEDELGCPIEVVFKALKEGFYTQTMHHTKQDNTWLGINDLGYTKEIFCMYFDENMSNIETCVERDLKDYKKTWWLNGDRSE